MLRYHLVTAIYRTRGTEFSIYSEQVNLKRDIAIGIVEKVQETSSDTGIHNNVHVCYYSTI